jgi:UDP-glucose 4-epimerase
MILLTGATGYIGSHIWVDLLKRAAPVIGLDNLSNSSIERLSAIAIIAGVSPTFIKGDIRDINLLEQIFSRYQITEVIHLAALKDVQESEFNQANYYDVNVQGLEQIIVAMRKFGCYRIIFSSSAAIYGDTTASPINEKSIASPSNYYGKTKLQCEQLLAEEFRKSPSIHSVSLRYFNVAGWDSSGLLFDLASSMSHSLFAEIQKVLRGERSTLTIFGDDWKTTDGTCIRDYLHVSDLAMGHINALSLDSGCVQINLGLGRGHSVREVISEHERILGLQIATVVAGRRQGDVEISFADTAKAKKLIAWKPLRTLSDMCADSYRANLLNLATSAPFDE